MRFFCSPPVVTQSESIARGLDRFGVDPPLGAPKKSLSGADTCLMMIIASTDFRKFNDARA